MRKLTLLIMTATIAIVAALMFVSPDLESPDQQPASKETEHQGEGHAGRSLQAELAEARAENKALRERLKSLQAQQQNQQ